MANEPDNELRQKAAEAGMSPKKFVELSGRTTVSEYEKIAAEERKVAEGAQG